MVNRNYVRGRSVEYLAVKELQQQGYWTMRSAGSHGMVDVLAIDFNIPLIRLIQCKTGSYDEKGGRLQEFKNLPVSNIFSKELWFRERGRWEITKL